MTVATRLNPVFCAIDTPDLGEAQTLVRNLEGAAGGIKLGKEFFTTHGPAGVNQVTIIPKKKGKRVVVRVLEDRKAPKGKKRRVDALSEEAPIKLVSKGKSVSYYALARERPLFVTLEGPVNLEITSRLGFGPEMGREEDYRIQVLDNGKVFGTYYFTTDRSEVTTVEGHKDIVPGSWRSCDVKLGKGMHEIKLRLMDKDRQVYVKLNRILGD